MMTRRIAQTRIVPRAGLCLLLPCLSLITGFPRETAAAPPVANAAPRTPAAEKAAEEKAGATTRQPRGTAVVFLEQGWDAEMRRQFYTTSITSEMLPLSWFQALEQRGREALFSSDDNIRRYGYLPGVSETEHNPSGLPIGFATTQQTADFDVVRPFLAAGIDERTYRKQLAAISGGTLSTAEDGLLQLPAFQTVDNANLLDADRVQQDYERLGPFVGPNCAACHTSEIRYRGTRIRIDGGTTSADRIRFTVDLAEALLDTLSDQAKFSRFAARIRKQGHSEWTDESLKRQLQLYTQGLLGLVARNYPPSEFGPGRMDAFGLLYNEIVGMTIREPDNYRVSNAPVSYPPLWNVPRYDWFQWNSCVNNPMIRNVIEVLGAFGRQSVSQKDDQLIFDSSVQLEPLHEMWDWMGSLKPPQWPEAILGRIDRERVERGKALYRREQCHSCHADRQPFPQTPPNTFGRTFVRLTRTPIQDVGTDPLMSRNFVRRTARSGIMKSAMHGQETVSAFALFGAIGGGVMAAKFQQEQVTPKQQLEYFQHRETLTPDAEQLLTYKAEPLAGIWATAPYLHNGSIPNLYQLLLPPEQRRAAFYVGDNEYDPVRVGFESDRAPGRFHFDTTRAGNSNAGHDYGTRLTDSERWDLIEYLKTL